MYTNEQIRSAMGELVTLMGPDHKGPAHYGYPDGTGACFLGALCEYMGRSVPFAFTPATEVLGTVSPHMRTALGAAQYMNDTGFEWKWILCATDEILKLDECDLFHYGVLGRPVIEIVEHFRVIRSAETFLHANNAVIHKDHALAA